MSKRLTLAAAVFFAFASVAACTCSGTICPRADSVNRTLADKGAPCLDGGRNIDEGYEARCEEGIKSCTVDDVDVLTRRLDCLDKVGTCKPGGLSDWTTQVVGCNSELDRLTPSCRDAGL